ncbi:MAG: Gfo/Idh/MocA family oxidoreductase [Microbacteriaceae bacterium]
MTTINTTSADRITPLPRPRTLGVAMIGHAFMGRAHSNAWRNVASFFTVPAFAQRVLVGRDPSATAAAAARLGWAEAATDWRTAIAREDVDIVDICAPGQLHAEIAIAALRAGKHVLVEKPLANTLDQAQRMTAAAVEAARRGIVAMIGFNYRRVPALALARQLIADGKLGTIRQVRAAYLQDWLVDAHSPMSWRLRTETAGSGALGDLASHVVDQLQFLLADRITAVSGRTHTFVAERPGPDGLEPVTVDDAAWAILRFGSGALGSIEVSRMATGAKNELTIEIYGSAGALRFNLERLNELLFLDATEPPREQGFRRILTTEPEHPYFGAWWPQGHVLGWEHTFTHEIKEFLTAVDAGYPAAPSFDDGLAVQRVLHAITLSAARGGTEISIDPADPEPEMHRTMND